MPLIGLCGVARAGKDSVANILVARYGYTKLGFADGVRDMARAIDPFVEARHPQQANLRYVRYSALLQEVGYEAAKACPDVRRLLQRIGTEAVREVFGEDAWVDRVGRLLGLRALDVMVASHNPPVTGKPCSYDEAYRSLNIVISDVRFPNEAKFIRSQGGIVVRIERPGYGGTDPHPSEAQVADIETNATISATDMDELIASTELFMAGLSGYVDTMAQIASEPEPPRVYLAAPWAHMDDARNAKQELVDAGLDVVSTWTERDKGAYEAHADEMRRQGSLDRDEVLSANTLVILNLKKSEGKASEMGMALALGKRVILVGPREGNIFYHLAQVEQVDTVAHAIQLLGGMTPADRERLEEMED